MPRIRPAEDRDTSAIQQLIADVYAEYDCTLELDGIDAHLRDPGPYFRERGGEFWVVEHNAEIRATVAVLLTDDAGELKCLYVHPSLRRQGWGRRLSELTIDYTRRAGKPRIILWSDTRFLDAHRLYQRMGFGQCGRRELHDSNSTVEFGFTMDLS